MKYLYFFNKIKNIALSNKKAKSNDLSALKRNFFVSNRQKNNRSADTVISQTLERGRSMIEMLGVLAIMGLLAIGGIWGYQYAMGIYRAGQIQDVMAQAKALTVTKRTTSQNSLSSFLDKTATAGLNPAVNIVETTDASGRTIRIYTITLNNVEEHVQRFAYARKPNFAKMDIMLAPSADAVEETDQTKESWVDAGMSEGEYDILQQYTTLQSGKSLLFAFTTRSRRGIAGGSDGDGENAPTECPADMPFYDEATDSCSRCDVSLNEYWDPTQMKCIACTEPQDYWDETNYACSCPPSIPVYDSATNTCVECLVDTDCKDEAKPVCNAEHRCEPCPEGQFYNGTQCMLNCEDKKIWDREQQACVCNPAYYETDANGYCVCKTDETVEASIKSKGLSSSVYNCRLHITDLGRLKGTYYFKWISGVHIYAVENGAAYFDVHLHAGNSSTGLVTDTDLGLIMEPDMSGFAHYPAGRRTYTASNMMKGLSRAEAKYFTFDGSKMISLWFYDDYCHNNGGTMTVELRKVISSCPEAGGSSGGGSSDVECTTNADCSDSSKPICNASHICEACPDETPHWNGTACISCSDTTPIWNAETKECEVCPEQTPHWSGTTCIACSDSAPVWNAETKECEVCPEQTPHWNGTTCIACSDTTPIWNAETKECEVCPEQTPHWNGTACIACSDSKPIWNAEIKECEACPNNTPYWNGTTCIACSDSAPVWNSVAKECETCPSETPHWNGATCIACSDDTPIWNSSTKTCDTCPSDTPYWNGNACIACSDDTPLWNSAERVCEACPYPTPVWNGTACEECPESKPAWDGNQCEACPANTPYWNESEMDCESCPIETPHWDGIACVVCPDGTQWDGESCVPNSCAEKLVNAGVDSSTFTVDPNDPTRIFANYFQPDSDLDLSDCSLFVDEFHLQGTSKTFKVKNLFAKRRIDTNGSGHHIIATNDIITAGVVGNDGVNDNTDITANRIIGNILDTYMKLNSNQIYYCTYYRKEEDPIVPNPNGDSTTERHEIYSSTPQQLEECQVLCDYGYVPYWHSWYDFGPYWNSNSELCEACPSETPYWDGIACVVCPDGTQWDGESCVPNSCAEKLINAGVDPSTFTVDPNDPTRIIAPGELYLSGDIDLSECSLFVGDFRYRGGYTTLKVKNLISKGQIYMSEEEAHIIVENDVIANSLINGICDIGCGITANRFIGGELSSTVAGMDSDQIYYCKGYYLSTCQNRWQYITEDTDTTSSKTVNTASPSAFPGLPNVCPYPTSKYGSLPKKLEVCHMLCYDDTPRWNSETRECEACPAETPHWNGTECIACSDSKPVWNAETKECEACPIETPVWNGTRCVECVADSDCASNTDGRTMCDTDTNTCQEPEMMCPIGDYYEYATEAEAQWCVENCPEHFKKGNTCYSCYYMTEVSFNSQTEAQECADTCREIRGAYEGVCRLCTDTIASYWMTVMGNAQSDCDKYCPKMRLPTNYEPNQSKFAFIECKSCYTQNLFGQESNYGIDFDTVGCSDVCLNHIQVGQNCVSCDSTQMVSFSEESLAQECEDKCKGKRYASGKDCFSCLGLTTVSTDTEATECLQNCPNNFVTGNTCYSCQYGKYDIAFTSLSFSTPEEAQECANNCPGERFAYGTNCYSCSRWDTMSFSSEEEAQACANACGNKRYAEGTSCYYKFAMSIPNQTIYPPVETIPPITE